MTGTTVLWITGDICMRTARAESVAVFRILFGLLGFVAVVRFALKGWIDDLYIEPAYHFTYSGFWWIQPWPAWGMYLHFALLGLVSLGVAIGYRYRVSIVAFFLLFTYVELIDKTTYLNHYYWVSLVSFLMIFMPLNRCWSVDAMLSKSSCGDTVPVWVIWVLRGQLGVVYLFAGIAKLNPDWLFEAMPLRIWIYNSADVFLAGRLLKDAWVAYAMSWGGVIFDLSIVGWLLWSRSRPFTYVVLVMFHVITWLLFPIGMFPWLMICAALIFFSPDWPRRLMAKLIPSYTYSSLPDQARDFNLTWISRLAVAGLVVFAIFQVLMPLRHWVYPGNVRWNEEGYRFSWRVLLTEKTGDAVFRVRDVSTGDEWVVYPQDYLSDLQVERMANHPDMILSTAHIIADDLRSRGREVEVRADVFVSYNGREAARLIDPTVDLAGLSPGLLPKRWVLPVADVADDP